MLESVGELEKQGFEVIRLEPDETGNITEKQIYEAVNGDTILVTVMYVNNEVGSILPINAVKKAVKRANAPALIHIDCVQAYGKLPIKPSKIGADLVTVTAHKIHGPKGVGALYIKKGTRIVPRTYGGEQERKIRPGTESSALIAGFGEAVRQIPDYAESRKYIGELNAYARQELEKIEGVKINNPTSSSDYIISVYVPTFMTSQTVLQHLSAQYGVYVSNGSACAKGKKSHVLSAMKLSDNVIERTVRVSFGRTNTKQDVDELVKALKETVQKYPL